MNKVELAATLAEKCDHTKKDAAKIVDTLTETIAETLKGGDKVAIMGFGTFEVRERAARKGHNPATKEEIEIPASKAPVFKAGKAFKDAVQ